MEPAFDYNGIASKSGFELGRDTSAVTHAVSAREGFSVEQKFWVDVTSGYDLARREFTPTNLNFYVDLHCWEFSFNWIPWGASKLLTSPQCEVRIAS